MATDIETFEAAMATTVDQGGGTFWTTGEPFAPSSGYAVAIGGVILDPETTGAFRLRRAFRTVSRDYGASFVGTWLDDGQLYVDSVRFYGPDYRDLAIADGREHNQLAIFDFAAGESIALVNEEA
jgi:hypothetical protein